MKRNRTSAGRTQCRSAFCWLADFANGGQNVLLAKPIPERPPEVSTEEVRSLSLAIRDETPLQFSLFLACGHYR